MTKHHIRKHRPDQFGLDDVIPFDVISCEGHKFYQTENRDLLTFRQVIEMSGFDPSDKKRIIIIAEDPLRGKVYDYGNYDDEEVREIGQTIGYA